MMRNRGRLAVQELRVACSGLASRCLGARWAQRWHARALYGRGVYRTRIGGIAGRFHITEFADYRHLVEHGGLPRAEIAGFLALVRPGDVVYDIGGHIGTWSVFIGRKLAPGRLVVFEPAPHPAQRCRQNLALNGLDGAAVHELAVSDANGQATFNINTAPGDTRHSLLPTTPHQHTITVRTIRLDDVPATLGLPPPNVLKIDCEGGEDGVLRGGAAVLAAPALRAVWLEMHPQVLAGVARPWPELAEQVRAAGFDLVRQQPRATEIICEFRRPLR